MINAAVPMKRWRVWMVGAVAALLVAGHAYDIRTQTEHWPFSYYPMYGRAQKKNRLHILSLIGIVQDGKKSRMHRLDSGHYVPQMSEARTRNILMASWGRDGKEPGAERETGDILRDYLAMYEARRAQGLHDGPQLSEIRLCRLTWVIKNDVTGKKPREIEPLLGVRRDGKRIPYQRQKEAAAATKPVTPDSEPDDDEAD